MQHAGHVAIVTGAAQGIGRAYAQALAEDGAQVVCADLNATGAQATADLITNAGGAASAIMVDVSDQASTLQLAAEVRAAFEVVHILVNNAAIYHSMRLEPTTEVDIAYWRKVMGVNLDGALLMTQAVAPLMTAGWGRVINQTSIAAYGAAGVYSTSKLALIGLTFCQAAELGSRGITVNAIAPGVINTEATLVTLGEERAARSIDKQAIKLPGTPGELVGTLRYLCGDGARFVTSQVLNVDGGMTTRI